MSARDRLRHARVLDLHRHPAPVGQHGAVHLADRGRRRGLLLEVLEQLLGAARPTPPRAPLRTFFQGIGGAEVRSWASCSWYSSRYSGGRNSVSMNEASWPIFIAAPFIRPERLDHPLRGLEVAALQRLGGRSGERAMLAARVPA